MHNRLVYLNTSSTAADITGEFNISDPYAELVPTQLGVEHLSAKICDVIHAPPNTKIVYTSGSTEAIATCIHWLRKVRPHSVVVGSSFDHKSVKQNCELYNVPYEKTLLDKTVNDRAGMLMFTHVCSKNGEILDMDVCTKNLRKYSYLEEVATECLDDFVGGDFVLQYRPLRVLDATQSIMKVPIYMDKWNLNALFFSMHKIGGPQGLGVLAISETDSCPFVPLIAGYQQGTLRGGTMPLGKLIEDNYFADERRDDYNTRVKRWKSAVARLKDEGLNVYEPTGRHLYNTLLIDCGKQCANGIVRGLSEKGIYVGNKSSCLSVSGKRHDVHEGGSRKPFTNAVRISFVDPTTLTDSLLDVIGEEIKVSNSFDEDEQV